MNMEKEKIRNLIDLLIWDDTKTSRIFHTVDRKGSKITSQIEGKKKENLKCIYILENKCGNIGFSKINKVISEIEWGKIATLFYISNSFSEIKKIEKLIGKKNQGDFDIYGIKQDYYFSLLPIKKHSYKMIENFIMSLKSRTSLIAKIKFFIKKTLICLNLSIPLYDRFVFVIRSKR